jgi:hypothetical protein
MLRRTTTKIILHNMNIIISIISITMLMMQPKYFECLIQNGTHNFPEDYSQL